MSWRWMRFYCGKPLHRLTTELLFNVSDVFRNQSMAFEERQDAITARLRASEWCRSSETVQDLAGELGDAETPHQFDAVWDELYDEADRDRVWIVTT